MKGPFLDWWKLNRGWPRSLAAIAVVCSLLGLTPAVDLEKQELQVAVAVLRKENSELKRQNETSQRELALATNRLVQVEWQQGDSRLGLVADDDDARSGAEWRSFLHKALKVLDETDREMLSALDRMRRLMNASQSAFKTAEKIDPTERARLEAELRHCEKFLSGKEGAVIPLFLPGVNASALSAAKVLGVQLDLGVAALDVGRKDGARVGMPFLVVRGEDVMAVLTLVEVRDEAALALIEQMDARHPIQKGDAATLRKL